MRALRAAIEAPSSLPPRYHPDSTPVYGYGCVYSCDYGCVYGKVNESLASITDELAADSS